MTIRFLSTFLLSTAALTFAACQSDPANGENGTTEHAAHEGHDHDGHDHGDAGAMASAFDGPRLSEDEFMHHGAKVAAADANATAAAMVADPASFDGKPVLMAGKVTSVCKSAGCWIMLGDGENEVFIDTKHQFTVPFDCDGRDVVIEGVAATRENSSGETEPVVVASGIALRK